MRKNQIQKELTTFFKRFINDNDKFFIKQTESPQAKFAVAKHNDDHSIKLISDFINHKEMYCYFFGILASREKKL